MGPARERAEDKENKVKQNLMTPGHGKETAPVTHKTLCANFKMNFEKEERGERKDFQKCLINRLRADLVVEGLRPSQHT